MPRGARDANEHEIIEALRAAGATVLQLEDPDHEGVLDLLVGFGGHVVGFNLLMEVKVVGKKLRPGQERWARLWNGPVITVWSVQDALNAIGVRSREIPRLARRIAQSGG